MAIVQGMTPHETRARAALQAWLDGDGPERTQAALARALGIAGPSVNGWVLGRSRPEPHLRQSLEILTGIPAGDWDTDAERAIVERVRAAVDQARSAEAPTPLADYGFPAPTPGGLVGAVRHAAREIQRAAAEAGLSAALQTEITERVTLSVLVAEYHANTLLRRL